MAHAVPTAFAEGGLWLAVGYVMVRDRTLLVDRVIATALISAVIVVAGGIVAGWLIVVVSAIALGGLVSEHAGGRRVAPAGLP